MSCYYYRYEYIYIYICICIHHTCIGIHIYIYIYIHTPTHTCVYIYIYIYIHTGATNTLHAAICRESSHIFWHTYTHIPYVLQYVVTSCHIFPWQFAMGNCSTSVMTPFVLNPGRSLARMSRVGDRLFPLWNAEVLWTRIYTSIYIYLIYRYVYIIYHIYHVYIYIYIYPINNTYIYTYIYIYIYIYTHVLKTI